MSFSVVFMPEANRDMDDIEDYMSQFYASTARSFFTKLKGRQLRLKQCHTCTRHMMPTLISAGWSLMTICFFTVLMRSRIWLLYIAYSTQKGI